MNVLVDTSVWALALRRNDPEASLSGELKELVNEGRVVVIGPVRQELLSGIKSPRQFESVRRHLQTFEDHALTADDYEEAARCFNACRAKGVQGSNTGFLICAVALRDRLTIFTTDGDFEHFAEVLPIALHQVRSPKSVYPAP